MTPVNRRTDTAVSHYCVMIYDGAKIAALRRAKKWTGAKLAREAGLAQPSLWALEHQVTKKPKADTLIRVAAALGVSYRDITRPTRKGTVDLLDDLSMVFDRLDNSNKAALLAAARALLENQPKK
jgi:transcriptional regulator with XRE-family HTH domain